MKPKSSVLPVNFSSERIPMIATETNGAVQVDERDDDQLLFDELGETRIQAQKRWEREGVVEQAAEFRMAQRKKNKAAGMTRSEAGDAAWRETVREFPSPAMKHDLAIRERIRLSNLIRDRGQSVPENVAPALPGELAFADIWAAVHELLAEEFYFANPPREPGDTSRYTPAHARRNVISTLRTAVRNEGVFFRVAGDQKGGAGMGRRGYCWLSSPGPAYNCQRD